jgi:hypothetical protein
MPVDRRQDCRFASDKALAQRTAKGQLTFIIGNKLALLKLKNGERLFLTAAGFNEMRDNFTDKQMSFIDSIYEETFKGLGFESFKATWKPGKRRTFK